MSGYTPSEWEVDSKAVWQTWHSLLLSFAQGALTYETLYERALNVYRREEEDTEFASVPFSHWALQHYSFRMRRGLTGAVTRRYQYALRLADSIAENYIDGVRTVPRFHRITADFGVEHRNAPLLSRGYPYQSELYETLSLAHRILRRKNRVSIQDISLLDIGFQVNLSYCVTSVLHRNLITALLPSQYSEDSSPGQSPSTSIDDDYSLIADQLVGLDEVVQRITGHREFEVAVTNGGYPDPGIEFSDRAVSKQLEP